MEGKTDRVIIVFSCSIQCSVAVSGDQSQYSVFRLKGAAHRNLCRIFVSETQPLAQK